MPEPTIAFVTVATPGYYWECAKALGKSLMRHATLDSVRFHICPGEVGPWPTGTITRPKIILESWDMIEMLGADYLFCIDADMLAESEITDTILGEIVATQHPGYVGHHRSTVPYDRNELSRAFIPMNEGDQYFCGGFFGGERESVRDLLDQMAWICEPPAPVPRWHDESALNRALLASPPTVTLNPSFCFPDESSYYEREVWPESHGFIRTIIALDKPNSARGDR